MPNAFNKQETVFFEELIQGYDDALVATRMAKVYNTDAKIMERSGDVFWRTVPYVAESFNGTDMTSNFRDYTQLSVPASLNFNKSVPWVLTEAELRDSMQESGIKDAATQRLSSDINTAVLSVASSQGTLVVKRTTAPTGFDDFALAKAVLTESGVDQANRVAAVTARVYGTMAGNLASRQTLDGKTQTAYDESKIGRVSGFDVFELDYGLNLLAASGTSVTVNGANQFYVPKATVTTANGTNNVDNRYQNLVVTVSSGTIRVGDAFTIAGVNNIHQISKTDTGILKTFRVTAIISGGGGSGTIQISPPIISNGGNTAAEAQYKNVTATPANGAAITWLNTVTGSMNPFWHKNSIEILPGRFPKLDNAGVSRIEASTKQGFQLRMTKSFDIKTNTMLYRVDTTYGVVNLQPQMSGIILFNQT